MISKNDVQSIARLARIELTFDEEVKFERELSTILDFVAKLNQVDTSAVEPLTGGTDLVNVMREDEPATRHPEAENLIDAAPQKRDGYVEVKAVFERE